MVLAAGRTTKSSVEANKLQPCQIFDYSSEIFLVLIRVSRMPVRRKGEEQQNKGNVSDEVLKDNDEVFYCELSNAIFRNYE